MLAPSGRQYEISYGDQTATVTEVGATLRVYDRAGEAVIEGFGEYEMCQGGRGQPLIPWPNRLEDGTYQFEGHTGTAALDEPERHNAIHGLVRWSNWEAVEHEGDRVVMSLTLHPQPAYPFTLGLTISYALGPDGLTVETGASNLGTSRCPLGVGFHPYLTVGTQAVDDIVLRIPARSRWRLDGRGLPVGRESVEGTELDFSVARPIGDLRMDTAFVDLERSGDGTVTAQLRARQSGRALTLWAGSAFTQLMCFTGDTLAQPWRRRALALEPMTCPPNALRTGEGLILLAPGEEFAAAWGLNPG